MIGVIALKVKITSKQQSDVLKASAEIRYFALIISIINNKHINMKIKRFNIL